MYILRDNAARLLVSGWREYNIYMYIRRIVVPVKNYDIICIYIYINTIVVVVDVSKILVRARRVSRVLVQLHVNTQHRSYLHDRCRMTQVAQVNATTSHREAFSFYILFRDIERSSPWSFELNRELVPRSTFPTIIQLHLLSL